MILLDACGPRILNCIGLCWHSRGTRTHVFCINLYRDFFLCVVFCWRSLRIFRFVFRFCHFKFRLCHFKFRLCKLNFRLCQELFTAHTKQSGTPLTVHQALVLKNLDDRRAAVKALKDFEKIKESSPEHRSYRGGAASQALPPKRSPSPTPRIGSMPSEP